MNYYTTNTFSSPNYLSYCFYEETYFGFQHRTTRISFSNQAPIMIIQPFPLFHSLLSNHITILPLTILPLILISGENA